MEQSCGACTYVRTYVRTNVRTYVHLPHQRSNFHSGCALAPRKCPMNFARCTTPNKEHTHVRKYTRKYLSRPRDGQSNDDGRNVLVAIFFSLSGWEIWLHGCALGPKAHVYTKQYVSGDSQPKQYVTLCDHAAVRVRKCERARTHVRAYARTYARAFTRPPPHAHNSTRPPSEPSCIGMHANRTSIHTCVRTQTRKARSTYAYTCVRT